MSKSINILDKDYIQWIKDLSSRYRRSQIKASVKVNCFSSIGNWVRILWRRKPRVVGVVVL